jgi:hypothetical protein
MLTAQFQIATDFDDRFLELGPTRVRRNASATYFQ